MAFKKIEKIIEEKISDKIKQQIIKKNIEEIITRSGITTKNFKVLSIEGERITIQTDNASARSELSFEKEQILKKINQNLKTKIKEARII